MALALIGGFLAVFGAVAPAGAATESFALSSATLPGQSSVGWQVGLGNPPATPNTWNDPITLTGQIDPASGAISAATLSMPSVTQPPEQGETPTFTFTEINPGTATGTYDASTGAVTLSDTLRLSFNITGSLANYTCDSSPITVAFTGTWDSGSENVTLSASGFTIPQFPDAFSLPTCSGGVSGPVLAGINASPGGIAGSVGNSMSLALHGQFAAGEPTTTTLTTRLPSPQLAGTSVTLTATVTDPSGQGTPTGSVNFLDNGASIGTELLDGSGTASLTTSALPSGANQQLTATYSGDPSYTGSIGTQAYTVTPLPSLGANLPSSVTAPTTAGIPTVSAVSPNTGPPAGGAAVTITGTNFVPGATVSFGSTPATDLSVVNATTITATAPQGTGTPDVTVSTPDGTSATSGADLFSYGTPTVTGVSPDAVSGSPKSIGFTFPTITGTNFVPGATVFFGSTKALADLSVLNATTIVVEAPSLTAGTTVDVTVETPSGTSPTSPADQFTNPPTTIPYVTSLSPTAGSSPGGTTVTISGGNFASGDTVKFGNTSAESVTYSSASKLTAVSPPGTGSVNVTVTDPNGAGTSIPGPHNLFAYGAPTVTGLSLTNGPAAGGSLVMVTGTNFVQGATVSFGGTAGSATVVVNGTELLTTSPVGNPGTVDVTVTNPQGTSSTSPADQFTYVATSGNAPARFTLSLTNPSSGQEWDNLYATLVLNGISGEPAANLTLSYQDTSGTWCPLTPAGTTTTFTYYFQGVGSTCTTSYPASFSLLPGASLSVPMELTYASGTYLGAQGVAATLFAGTCSGATSCTNSKALPTVATTSTVEVVPPAPIASTITDTFSTPVAGSTYLPGFYLPLQNKVAASTPATGVPTPTGTVTYLVDGTQMGTTTLNSGGTAPVSYQSTTGLSLGAHTLIVQYSGDPVFAPSSIAETFTVAPAPPGVLYTCTTARTPSLPTYPAYVSASAVIPSTAVSGSNVWVTNLTASMDIDPLQPFWSTQGYSSTFTLSPNGSAAGGQPATFTSQPTYVTGTWSGMAGVVSVSGNPGDSVPVALTSFTWVYSGTSTSTCTPASDPAPLGSVAIFGTSLTASPDGSSAAGSPVTLTAAVAPAPATDPGTVQFFDGSTLLGAAAVSTTTGTATFTTNALSMGDHQLSAQWSGTLAIPANTSNVVDYLVGTTTTTTLASSANPANAASSVNFTATVTPPDGATTQPTGDVSFTSDGNPISSCEDVALSMANPPTATCTTSFGAGETHSIVATYSGDATYLGSASDPLTQSTLAGTNTTILSTKDPSPPGNVTFWAGVSPSAGTGTTPTGTVAFTIDGKAYGPCAAQPLGSGAGASCTVSFKANTSHKVFATYAGSTTYSGSKSNTITQTVTGSSGSTKPKTSAGNATLGSGKTLGSGQSLTAGSYRLTMQANGNLVEYRGAKALWSTKTAGHPGTALVMQKDGNLVEYFQGRAVWATKTAGHAGSHLTLQAKDGNVVIYGPGGKALWSTGT